MLNTVSEDARIRKSVLRVAPRSPLPSPSPAQSWEPSVCSFLRRMGNGFVSACVYELERYLPFFSKTAKLVWLAVARIIEFEN